jgi:UDP-N-acetylglucosamine 4,6-dehydratase
MKNLFKDKSILVTGGTGSFGKKFISLTLEKYEPSEVIVFSRDEMKQWDMGLQITDPRVKFVIGDVRNKDSVKRVMQGVDLVVHAAATKIVPLSEFNAFECVKTNILGSMNVIDAAIDCKVKKVIALSTDKASSPINLYGATKLAADKLFVAANVNSRDSQTIFSVVRYGNVMGSRGSVIPFFESLKNQKYIPITDLRMTRFMVTLDQAVELVWLAFTESLGGEIFVKKIPSMRVTDMARCISPQSEFKVTGIRPGEKLHEQMIGIEDSLQTLEYDDYYKIIPTITNLSKSDFCQDGAKFVNPEFRYTSDENSEWMTELAFTKWLDEYRNP